MIARVAAVALAASLNLPQPIPPRTSGLVPGYHLSPHGCITNAAPGSFAEQNAAMTRRHGPYSSQSYDAQVATDRRKLHEVEHTNVWPLGTDRAIRVHLSIALYRTHRIAEARAQWRLLLSRARPGGALDDGTRDALAGRFHDALVAYAMSPPSFNTVTFGDSGAAYNLQRGLNAAAGDDLRAAETFLNYALECSDFFQVPHLALGVIAARRRDFTTARHEWLADLEGWDPAPPDTANVTPAQYGAMRLLLHFG